MSTNEIREVNLQLFADGGAASEGVEGGLGTNGSADGVPATSVKGVTKGKGKGNPLANVQYGKPSPEVQAAAASKETAKEETKETPEERVKRFDELRKGEFKDLFDEWAQDTVQKRNKGVKDIVDKYNAATPLFEMLGRKYGVDATDIAQLNKAIEEDDSYYEDEALEKGITVKQLKEVRKIERENAEMKHQIEDRRRQEAMEKDVAEWIEQAKEAQKSFPDLDLKTELQNPEFVGLLKSGVGVESAYFAMHHKELVPQVVQYAQKEAEKKLANNIMANRSRPVENGVNPLASAVVKSDPRTLTKEDRAEILRRVAKGEKIYF